MNNQNNLTINWSVPGQEKIKKFLERAVFSQNLSHAYWFFGPNGVGKKKLIKSFLQLLFCFSFKSENIFSFPCGKCSHCLHFLRNIHPDILYVEREIDEKKKQFKNNISIEQIRSLKIRLSQASLMNSYKVAVINDAETMSSGAMNALLKILEEPRERCLIILLSKDSNDLPETIGSRCQKFKISLLPDKEIAYFLQKEGVSEENSFSLAKISGGCLDRAYNFWQNSNEEKNFQNQIEGLISLIKMKNFSSRLIKAEEIIKNAEKSNDKIFYLDDLFSHWLIFWRDYLRYLVSPNLLDRKNQQSLADEVIYLETKYSLEKVVKIIQLLFDYKRLLKENINIKLILDNFLLKL